MRKSKLMPYSYISLYCYSSQMFLSPPQVISHPLSTRLTFTLQLPVSNSTSQTSIHLKILSSSKSQVLLSSIIEHSVVLFWQEGFLPRAKCCTERLLLYIFYYSYQYITAYLRVSLPHLTWFCTLSNNICTCSPL